MRSSGTDILYSRPYLLKSQFQILIPLAINVYESMISDYMNKFTFVNTIRAKARPI